MLDLAVMSMFGFSGYAALLAVAPLWVVRGGSTAAGAGLVNGVLLAATVLTQLAVPRVLATWGTGRVLVTGLLLLGLPAPAYLLSDELGWVLGLSAVRGAGFGILTVAGSTVVAQLVPASRRGAAIGIYGLSVALPNLLLLPGSVPIVDSWSFAPVFWAAGARAAAAQSAGRPPADARLARRSPSSAEPGGGGGSANRASRPPHRPANCRAVQRDDGRRRPAHLLAPAGPAPHRGAGVVDFRRHRGPVPLAGRLGRRQVRGPALSRPDPDLRRSSHGGLRLGGGPRTGRPAGRGRDDARGLL